MVMAPAARHRLSERLAVGIMDGAVSGSRSALRAPIGSIGARAARRSARYECKAPRPRGAASALAKIKHRLLRGRLACAVPYSEGGETIHGGEGEGRGIVTT